MKTMEDIGEVRRRNAELPRKTKAMSVSGKNVDKSSSKTQTAGKNAPEKISTKNQTNEHNVIFPNNYPESLEDKKKRVEEIDKLIKEKELQLELEMKTRALKEQVMKSLEDVDEMIRCNDELLSNTRAISARENAVKRQLIENTEMLKTKLMSQIPELEGKIEIIVDQQPQIELLEEAVAGDRRREEREVISLKEYISAETQSFKFELESLRIKIENAFTKDEGTSEEEEESPDLEKSPSATKGPEEFRKKWKDLKKQFEDETDTFLTDWNLKEQFEDGNPALENLEIPGADQILPFSDCVPADESLQFQIEDLSNRADYPFKQACETNGGALQNS